MIYHKVEVHNAEELIIKYKEGYSLNCIIISKEEKNRLFSLCLGKEDDDSIYLLSQCYYYSWGTAKDIEKFKECVYKLIARNNHHGYVCLGFITSKGDGVPQNIHKAIEYYNKAGELGNPSAYYNIAQIYLAGQYVEKDINIAEFYLIKSAKMGYPRAYNQLAKIYYNNLIPKKDFKDAYPLWLKASEYNIPEACYFIGTLYIHHKIEGKDLHDAYPYLLTAAENNHPQACLILGIALTNGDFGFKDFSLAVKYLEVAKSHSLVGAAYTLGYIYHQGFLGTSNIEEAFKNFLIAANNEDKRAYYVIGKMYAFGNGTNQDVEKGIAYLKKAIDYDNNYYASFELGTIYLNYKMITPNYELSVFYLEKALEGGVLQAKAYLSMLYFYGWGVKQDFKKAFDLINDHQLSNDLLAVEFLGIYYYNGTGTEQNYYKAFEYLNKALSYGSKRVTPQLAIMYINGLGVEKDVHKAIEILKIGVEHNVANACYNLALIYVSGETVYKGIKTDFKEAFRLFQLAAKQGNEYAHYNLGVCYELGRGIERDLYQAKEHYAHAAFCGLSVAKAALKRVEAAITELEERQYDVHHDNDVFISWNHHNKQEKDAIAKYLKERGLKVWESDSSGSGEVSKQCELGIKYSSVYLVLLSKKSIRSEWVKKELSLILEKEKHSPNLSELIRPIYIDDVSTEISAFEDTNPFKIISRLSSSFGVKEEEIFSIVQEMLSKYCLEAYNRQLFSEAQEFNLFMSEDLKDDEKGSVISTLVKYSEGYIERKLIDKFNDKYEDYQVFNHEQIFTIIAPGGTGKSLFLKNIIRKYSTLNHENKAIHFDYFFLIHFSQLLKYFKNQGQNLEQYLFDYLKSQNEDMSRRLNKLYLNDKRVIILIDALDEAGGSKEELQIISRAIQDYLKTHQNVKVIITTRNMQNVDDYLNNIPQYTLSTLNDEDIHRIVERLFKEFKVKIFDKEQLIPNINVFYLSLEDEIYKDIKRNPLLLINLVIIYFLKKQMPRSEYEIIDQASKIIINDVESKIEFGLNCQDLMKITNELLGYISFSRYIGSRETTKELISDYLEYKNITIDNKEQQIEDYLYYLKARSILVNDNLYHNMFRSYFSAKYLFELIYIKKSIPNKYYDFVSNGEAILEQYNKEHFKDESPWIEILSSLITRLDYSIYNLMGKEIDQTNLNYQVMNSSLQIINFPLLKRTNLCKQIFKLCRHKAFYNYHLIEKILKNINFGV